MVFPLPVADVGEIWRRARRDRVFREELSRDPASALAGSGLDDDDLALLDAALRGTRPTPLDSVFAGTTDEVDPPGPSPADRASVGIEPSGGSPATDRREPL